MSNWDRLISDLRTAQDRAEQSEKIIVSNLCDMSQSKRLKKSIMPWPAIERDAAAASRALAGTRIEQQRADAGDIILKAMTSFSEGKITAVQVSAVETRANNLCAHLSTLQKALENFDVIKAQIKTARTDSKNRDTAAASKAKSDLDGILRSIQIMQDRLDLSEAEATKLKALAEGTVK